ncbi:glycosyltransferase [Reichenbachiella agariperforans]|uniref:glycosyltransferase n=1 Tax=Reichenbachiella agariperforans TaxID=156994 RepID=UPI001C08C443|nr:glycosyltransferase [Reichenbachiella agariperforans]MBU2915199.1 glycosyltransferase [Reichenbachiella agariperforans]
MNTLHITSWYPTHNNPKSALWVQRHIVALTQSGCNNKIYHLEVNKGDFQLNLGKTEILGNKSYRVISSFLPWFLMEMIAGIMLVWILWKERNNQYNIINFHIAYPNLTYWHWIKRWVKTPIVITEHWSAFHDNFGLPPTTELPRAQRIFRQQIPVIAVSNALLQDIKRFSKANFPSFVVPNVVDTETFRHLPDIQSVPNRFFMVSLWKTPKDPFTTIRGFAEYTAQHPDAQLRIGGYGPELGKMHTLVDELSIAEQVVWLGTLDSDQIAKEMNTASAFVHLSDYETFSVVCAEAACCGCPVIASKIGGIPEFIDETNGVLLKNKLDLFQALSFTNEHSWDSKELADLSAKKFNFSSVGRHYTQNLSLILSSK